MITTKGTMTEVLVGWFNRVLQVLTNDLCGRDNGEVSDPTKFVTDKCLPRSAWDWVDDSVN